jgi:sarcosine oxidase subunit alpha
LVRVDGVPNQYACQVTIKPGMRVERQNAFPDASVDVLQATDFVFSKWFNHHEFLAGVPIVERVVLQVARKLAGLGVLPEGTAPSRPPALVESFQVAVIGGGCAGLAATRTLAERGVPFVLFERGTVCGGRLLTGCEQGVPAPVLPARGEVRTEATVVGVFADDGRTVLAVIQAGRLHLVFVEHVLFANGGQPTLVAFPNNDLPGVFASRAVSLLIRRHGVLPGKRVAVLGEIDECRALAQLIAKNGGEPVAIGGTPLRAHGLRSVQAVTYRPFDAQASERTEKANCDAIALCGPVSPAFELARSAGAHVGWDERARLFVVQADARGKAAHSVFVAGELRGPMSASTAAEQGLVAASALSDELKASAS